MRGGLSVELNNVSRRYVTAPGESITALDNVSLRVAPGTVVGVTGPAGSGSRPSCTSSAPWTRLTGARSAWGSRPHDAVQ